MSDIKKALDSNQGIEGSSRNEQAARETVAKLREKGPVYGVPLIDTLPLNTSGLGMLQRLPDREDLEQVRKRNERVVAGYEVVLNYYTEQRATIEALRRRVAELGAWQQKDEGLMSAQSKAIDSFSSKIDTLTAENAELKASFDLYAQAAERGRKLYQESTGDDSEWPDMGHLICWLMERIDELQGDKDAASSEVEILEECNDENIATVLRLGDENAELKRQVEALREDAEVGALFAQLATRRFGVQPSSGNCWVHINPEWQVGHGVESFCSHSWKESLGNALEALREAAKGEVE